MKEANWRQQASFFQGFPHTREQKNKDCPEGEVESREGSRPQCERVHEYVKTGEITCSNPDENNPVGG